MGDSLRRTAVRALALAAAAGLVFGVLLLPLRLRGRSMEPTFGDGGWVLAWRLAYRWSPPARGDVVAIRLAGESVVYLKRVVGLPGELVGFRAGRLEVDGRPQAEPYRALPCTWELPAVLVGPTEVFVVGDNRSTPPGLHPHGRVERTRLAGKVVF